MYNGILTYSDRLIIYQKEGELPAKRYWKGLQPYFCEYGLLYQQDNHVYLGRDVLIDKPDDVFDMGRPTVAGDTVYYERNKKGYSPATWEIWKYNMITKKNEYFITGANPFHYKDKLYYSFWTGKEYEIRWVYD